MIFSMASSVPVKPVFRLDYYPVDKFILGRAEAGYAYKTVDQDTGN